MGTINRTDDPWRLLVGWMTPSETEKWTERLIKDLCWEQEEIFVYGKRYLTPRLTSFVGEFGIKYKYSKVLHDAVGFPRWFYPLLQRINKSAGKTFNACLLNFYRNGNDRMGWHSDNEAELDPLMPIASLSLGARRDFFFKKKNDHEKRHLSLDNGDLLIMYPPCQSDWLHSLPRRKNIYEPRLNLTFRCFR